MTQSAKVGLVLAGGGARAAYQAGVMLAISHILPDARTNPFPVISGTSAGAINATGLACAAHDFRLAAGQLAQLWRQIRIEDVYQADMLYFLKTFLHFGVSIASAGRLWSNPKSFLDNAPLREYLGRVVAFDGIDHAIASGSLRALALTASCFNSGQSVTFFDGAPEVQAWTRQMRVGVREKIGIDHLMASSALPLIFPATRVGDRYFCDGAVRQMAPLSPALHLGAQKLFVVGLAGNKSATRDGGYPSPAQVFGHLLNSIFADSMASDMERLIRVNHTVSLLSGHSDLASQTPLQRVEVFLINPSASLEDIARKHVHLFPPVLRFLLHGTGATRRRGLSLATYLLFEPGYCRELIALGYRDVLKQKEAILNFLEL
ncbi:MAG: patatin-like phospholipase family protein [Paludibacterium sp.]|uniref:patatin-like phospholipase family protein n=1 Tax=Paludibacterium sp. TaxID=1917523 RepID=UPI0026014029|nr:patatin-like phospholipase family protein [Paludibacterium sp.]MBV8045633.1 patatin-like phospholipase family protein [Paludibacterium sp.]MBV8647537.1 patatin-like phospholipase family protein [Paludibacterium sp.]